MAQQSLAIPRVIPNDWKRLDLIVNKIKFHLGSASNPTFAGVTVTGLTASTLVGANADKALESVTIGLGLNYTRPTLKLSHLGIQDLTDPGADRIFFWDNGVSKSEWLSVGPSLAITATNLDTIQNIQTTASPTFANLSLGTGELTAGSINRAAGTLTLEIAGTAEISISSTTVTLGGNLVIPDTGYIGSASDPNAIQIAASGEVTFTDVITGILPTAGAHLATKEYVDLAIGASADFFLSDNDDAVIADYHILYDTDTGGASSTLVTDPMVENDDQLMFSYITASGVPGVEFLRAGVYILHTHLSRGTGDKPTTFYWTLSKYTLGDVETVLLTSEESSTIPDSTISFITHATLAADTAILVTDRLVLKLYANVGAAGGNSEVTIHMEGTHDCHLTNQLPSSIWQNQGDVLDDLNITGVNTFTGDPVNDFLVGTAAGTLVWQYGATARTSMGVGTGDSPQFTGLTLTGNIVLPDDGTIGVTDGTPSLLFDDTLGNISATGNLLVSGYADIAGCSAIGPDAAYTPLITVYARKIHTLTSSADNSSRSGIYAAIEVGKTGLADFTGNVYGLRTYVEVADANTQDWTSVISIRGLQSIVATGGSSTGTVTGTCGLYLDSAFYDAATVTNYYGIYMEDPYVVNNKLINAYGIYLKDFNTALTLNYAIYTNAGLVHFGGAVDMASSLTMTGNITIANGGTIGQAAGPLITFNDTANDLGITGCEVGVGLTNPQCTLDILAPNSAAGGIRIQDTLTDEADKRFRLKVGHYTNSEEPITLFFGYAAETVNTLIVGGGSGVENALSIIDFNTAATNTTLTGSIRMRIRADGGIQMYGLKSGADQAAAGAIADELYHDTDDNTIKIGV